jgi:hypothetical protein
MNIPVKELRRILAYLSDDERRHYEDMRASGDSVSGHIYKSVLVVEDCLQEDDEDEASAEA